MKEYIINLMARDRVGIISDVARAAAKLGGNITNASQTVMRDYFTLIFSVTAPESISPTALEEAIVTSGADGEFDVNIREFTPQEKQESVRTENFILTVQGKDTKGIISKISEYLCKSNINIDDFYSYIHESDLLILAQISVPEGTDITKIQNELTEVGREFSLSIHFQHENIFKATSEIPSVMSLGRA